MYRFIVLKIVIENNTIKFSKSKEYKFLSLFVIIFIDFNTFLVSFVPSYLRSYKE